MVIYIKTNGLTSRGETGALSQQPWSNEYATEKIRKTARSQALTLTYTTHARDRIRERGLIMSDVLYVLKNGFVHVDPTESTREGYYKYYIECKCPNGGNRCVRVVVIPENEGCFLKIVTVMWLDQPETRSGSIIGEYHEQVSLH